MRYAVAEGHRLDDPAGDAILQVLPKIRVAPVHYRAIHYSLVREVVRKVRDSNAKPFTKMLAEFILLTVARSGEGRCATWAEMDLEGATWTIPAERMKARKEHRVPLSPRCVDILREAKAMPRDERSADSPLVFPSRGKVLSAPTIGKLLENIAVDTTVHGLRSTFRDWGAEQTDAPREVLEACLAHGVKDKAEAAYARSDLLDKRREVMEKWAAFVANGNPA